MSSLRARQRSHAEVRRGCWLTIVFDVARAAGADGVQLTALSLPCASGA
jgi:hypothetical protein